MNADTLHAPSLPFNPDVLRWAREWRGRAIEEAAQKINVSKEKIHAWETGEASPTVRQARILATFYERPFLEFFLSKRPNVPISRLAPDFRLHRKTIDPRGDREVKSIQDWAEEARQNALDLFSIVGDDIPIVPEEFRATLDANPERIAILARKLACLPIKEQLDLKSGYREKVIKDIRHGMERLGILVLKDSRLGKYGVRGLTVFAEPLPLVVFGAEAPSAQSFTLAHELGHIALQQSAISGPSSTRESFNKIEQSEKWCNEFAAAFLIPASELGVRFTKPNFPQQKIDDSDLRKLANIFAVSPHAMLVRLVHLGYIVPEYYWDIKHPEFLKQEAEFKGGGKSKYYGTRFRNAYGDLYTGLVLEAWGNGRITNHNAAEFMGTKNLKHLLDIRDNFFS